MGRKSDPNISESFEELHSVRSADRKAKEQKIKKQWDNLHKLVPVYDLSDDDKPSASRVNGDGQPTKKMAQLRNSGESSKGIRLADIEKEADKIATPKDLKRFHESPKRVFEDTPLLHGADVLGYGNRPAKRARHDETNGFSNAQTERIGSKKLADSDESEENAKTSEPAAVNGKVVSFDLEDSSDEDDSYEDPSSESSEENLDGRPVISPNELDGLLEDAEDIGPMGDSRALVSKKSDTGLKLQERVIKPAFNFDDEDMSSGSDESFVPSDEVEEEPMIVGENDLMGDISEETSGLEDFNEDMIDFDDSDEERITHLDEAGLELKTIGLTIDGYSVDESVLQFLKIRRDENVEIDHTPTRYNLFCFSSKDEHSVNTAIKAFKFLIFPLGVQEFFEHVYTKRAAIIRRADPDYNANLFPAQSFYEMFQQNFLEYGVSINVAKYEGDVRTTHNPDGRVHAGAIRAFIEQGLSIQCVNPQSFSKDIHYVCEILQELFNCFVGANCYYTPKGSAGFAPHYDDIDAFMIQTEGQKFWKVWAPPNSEGTWPLESSGNFTLEEMEDREDDLVFSGWLKAGDVLYLPRGFIHCAKTNSKHDSLHVTISVAQNHNYSELLEKLTSKLLESKTIEIAQLRKNLPVNLLEICGVADSRYDNEELFMKQLERPLGLYLEQFLTSFPNAISASVDDMARDFMKKALPPLLSDYEKGHSIHGVVGSIPAVPEIVEETEVRLIRKHTQRLLFESDNKAFIIHRMENSLVYEGRTEVIVELPSELIDCVEKLFKCYPDWKNIAALSSDLQTNFVAVQFLYERGLLLIRENKKMKLVNKKKKQLKSILKKKKEVVIEVPKKLIKRKKN